MPKPRKDQMSLTADLVACCERPVPDPGPRPDITHFSDADFTDFAERLAAQNGTGPVWVFAYGSLIWNPGFTWDSYRRATVHGWHRCFSMKMERWRGTPEQPGLMMALERGGSCEGIAYRLPADNAVGELVNLLKREVEGVEDSAHIRWVKARTDDERFQALVFYALPKGVDFPKRPSLDMAAHMLARACGHAGSGAAYLHRTVEKLAEHGICDRNLWRLQEMVAAEIKALRK